VSSNELVIATLNLQDGGWSAGHGDYRGMSLLSGIIGQIPGIDVLLFQEGKGYSARGQMLRFRAEELLRDFGLRSFMTRSVRGQLHELVFIRWPRLRPVAHYTPDLPDVFHDQVGVLRFRAAGLQPALVVKSVQWASWNGDVRLDEAQKLTRHASPDTRSRP
jgi:hypothetical protein